MGFQNGQSGTNNVVHGAFANPAMG